jgi:hypothetical protein
MKMRGRPYSAQEGIQTSAGNLYSAGGGPFAGFFSGINNAKKGLQQGAAQKQQYNLIDQMLGAGTSEWINALNNISAGGTIGDDFLGALLAGKTGMGGGGSDGSSGSSFGIGADPAGAFNAQMGFDRNSAVAALAQAMMEAEYSRKGMQAEGGAGLIDSFAQALGWASPASQKSAIGYEPGGLAEKYAKQTGTSTDFIGPFQNATKATLPFQQIADILNSIPSPEESMDRFRPLAEQLMPPIAPIGNMNTSGSSQSGVSSEFSNLMSSLLGTPAAGTPKAGTKGGTPIPLPNEPMSQKDKNLFGGGSTTSYKPASKPATNSLGNVPAISSALSSNIGSWTKFKTNLTQLTYPQRSELIRRLQTTAKNWSGDRSKIMALNDMTTWLNKQGIS